ncbi:MAG TPA: BadF/BadG/BcrA/BcrD ATPase family protein [Abditibacterium sp.]|jgi:N-acetylglucosamine kinase-like BadF-type ATPase
MNYRIGIDGGGTKTRAVVLSENLEIVGEGAGGSSNIYAVGLEKTLQNILESADFALSQAGLQRENIESWGLGLGGVSSGTESAQIEAGLRPFLVQTAKIVVAEDVVAAHRGAFPEKSSDKIQVVCIAGTGANSFGRNHAGETAQSDGLGPLLGDRGSGYRIGEAALRLFGLESDGVLPQTEFSRQILAHFEAKNLAELIQIVYAPDFQRSRVASLAPLVVRFATENSGAREILENAGNDLAQTARAVLRRLSLSEKTELKGEVALIGGVLAGSYLVRESFQHALGDGIELVEARYESAIGAALLV